jgi:DegV family protein with EDD domain
MAGIRVVTDSACDLPQALADQHGIEIVPLTIRFGDEELVDRRDLSPKEFWARSAESPVLPETAAPSAGAFEETYKRLAGEGADGIVCVTLSSELSATHQAASLAAKSFSDVPIRVVDSKAVTMAQGLMALAAAKLGEQGSSIDECAQAVEDLVARSRIYATLDTLENLKKGGRIGAAQAFFGSLLSIKPVIELSKGFVEAESKQRTRSKSLRYLVEKVKEHGEIENLVVMHGEAPDLEEFLDLVSAVYPRDDIIVGDIGAVIGTHGGPRVMGVVFHVPR